MFIEAVEGNSTGWDIHTSGRIWFTGGFDHSTHAALKIVKLTAPVQRPLGRDFIANKIVTFSVASESAVRSSSMGVATASGLPVLDIEVFKEDVLFQVSLHDKPLGLVS